jgi:hypothetical protein
MHHHQVVEVNMKAEESGPHNPHNNAFYAEETILRSELEAQRDCNSRTNRHWLVQLYSLTGPFFVIIVLLDHPPSVWLLKQNLVCNFGNLASNF